jgi:anaerobic C4-dicarboxylate transporter
MDSALILLQGAVVIIAILVGVRMGGIGLGLWGIVGLAVLIFGFGLPPGEPPTSSMFIILMVITAASTMQAVGGIDYLVEVAKTLLKRKPALIALIAPIVAFIFTLGAGTGFIYYSFGRVQVLSDAPPGSRRTPLCWTPLCSVPVSDPMGSRFVLHKCSRVGQLGLG